MSCHRQPPLPPALPTPYNGRPGADGPHETPELRRLVETQVKALVSAAPAAAQIPNQQRESLEERVTKIATHAAALALEDWQQSEQLGQRPLLKTEETLRPEEAPLQTGARTKSVAAARAQALARPLSGSGFQQDATSRVGAVTRSTLRAISFPTFVADLIKGTFSAILDATTTQMGAFMEMLESVSKTVEQFQNENVSDGQANQWLAQQYPSHIRLEQGDGGVRAVPTDNASEGDPPEGIQGSLNLPDAVDVIDDVTIEEVLIPAARRKMAQSRLQMLSSLVMMGLQRIVINHGRIRATMGFHIDATDSASREEASLLDTSISAQAQVGFGMWSASASTSVTYVRSTKANSDAALNVNADLTGEVDLTFSTDYMPLNRMATTENIARIRNNTPVPSENAPAQGTGVSSSAADSPSASQMITSRLEHREELEAPDLPDINQGESQPGASGRRSAGGSDGDASGSGGSDRSGSGGDATSEAGGDAASESGGNDTPESAAGATEAGGAAARTTSATRSAGRGEWRAA